MKIQIPLSEIKLDTEFDWYKSTYVEISDEVRLYWRVTDLKLQFACIECTGHECYPNKVEPWDLASYGEVWFEGYGYRGGDSGVRHLYFIGEEEGYFYYPKLFLLSSALRVLGALEKEYTDYEPVPAGKERC